MIAFSDYHDYRSEVEKCFETIVPLLNSLNDGYAVDSTNLRGSLTLKQTLINSMIVRTRLVQITDGLSVEPAAGADLLSKVLYPKLKVSIDTDISMDDVKTLLNYVWPTLESSSLPAPKETARIAFSLALVMSIGRYDMGAMLSEISKESVYQSIEQVP